MVTFVNDDIEAKYISLLKNDRVKKKIDWIIEQIKINPTFGEPIAKRLIPLSKTEINATIIEWFTNHKSYDKGFGY